MDYRGLGTVLCDLGISPDYKLNGGIYEQDKKQKGEKGRTGRN